VDRVFPDTCPAAGSPGPEAAVRLRGGLRSGSWLEPRAPRRPAATPSLGAELLVLSQGRRSPWGWSMCLSIFIKRPGNDTIYLLHRLVVVAVAKGSCPLVGTASCCTETAVLQSGGINFCREVFESGPTSCGDQELCVQAEREAEMFATEAPWCCWWNGCGCLWGAWSAWLKWAEESSRLLL